MISGLKISSLSLLVKRVVIENLVTTFTFSRLVSVIFLEMCKESLSLLTWMVGLVIKILHQILQLLVHTGRPPNSRHTIGRHTVPPPPPVQKKTHENILPTKIFSLNSKYLPFPLLISVQKHRHIPIKSFFVWKLLIQKSTYNLCTVYQCRVGLGPFCPYRYRKNDQIRNIPTGIYLTVPVPVLNYW